MLLVLTLIFGTTAVVSAFVVLHRRFEEPPTRQDQLVMAIHLFSSVVGFTLLAIYALSN